MTVDYTIKILLVEDSRFVRRTARKALNKLGFQNVVEAEDGNEAIEKLQKNDDIGLIISDWVMPNKDGYEFLLWARADKKRGDIPFIMATARGEKKQVTKAVEAGVTDFITKPYEIGEIKALIEKIFAAEETEEPVSPEITRPRKTTAGRALLNVAHIQITDHLSLGVMKHMLATEKLNARHFELDTVCMSSWNPVQKALETGEVDAAFILAPIAMDLFSFGAPIKVVLLAHKSGSIFVWKREAGRGESLRRYFQGKTFYIPHEMSIHHMLSHKFLRGVGLQPGFEGMGDFDVFFEVVPPIKMPEYLAANPNAGGFAVAEPLGTQAIAEGIADLMFLSGQLWENHPCCVVAMRDELIDQNPEAVQEFVRMLVQAGQFIEQNPETAAAIGVPFLDPNGTLGLKDAILRDVLKESQGIKTIDLFPIVEDFDRIQRYMVDEMNLGSLIDLEKFLDTRFAKSACKDTVSQKSVMHNVSGIVTGIVSQRANARLAKTKLNLEEKYLIFTLDNGDYGLDVRGVKEIIEMKHIRPVPQSPAFVKGIIDIRDQVIPVIDLRCKLGMETSEHSKRTRIIILEIAVEKDIIQMGIVVDSVADVIDIKTEDIEETPPIAAGIDANYVLGVAKTNGKLKILLDAEQLFSEVNT